MDIKQFRVGVLLLILMPIISGCPSKKESQITWDQEYLNITLAQGEEESHVTSFSSLLNIDNATVSVSDGVTSIVSATQPWMGDIKKGVETNLALNFIVPGYTTPSIYEGEVYIVMGNGDAMDPPLKIRTVITEYTADGLPPDPGEAGKETLLGIDSDHDGVRDDVQRYIAIKYSDNKNVQNSLLQKARNYQILLAESHDKSFALKNAKIMSRDIECIWAVIGYEGAADASKDIKSAILNTYERSRAYIRFSNDLAGHIVRSNPTGNLLDGCDFKVDQTTD